ncbi:MAG: cob(I)yrinic acid a,c-diamide adenosyltransferase [Fibrobacterota bacterium]
MKSFLHVYTGNGKGKTTAAVGLSVRAAAAGRRVFFAQFLKKGRFSEIKGLEKFNDMIDVRQYGNGPFIEGAPSDKESAAAQKGLCESAEAMSSGKYGLVILDEGCCALKYGLFDTRDLIDAVRKRTGQCEVAVTGRGAAPELIEEADLVTEMKEIKHYYNSGKTSARRGIEF